MCPDRLGIERVPEVSDGCRPVCFGPQQREIWLWRRKSPWPVHKIKQRLLQIFLLCICFLLSSVTWICWMACCALVQMRGKKTTAKVTGFSPRCIFYLSESYVSLSLTFFPPSLCHASVSGSLLCSALKAMCARSCSCGLRYLDQQRMSCFYGAEFMHL